VAVERSRSVAKQRCDEGQALLDWRDANRRAPRDWRVLATRLAEHDDIDRAWAELRKHGGGAMTVFRDVKNAFRLANQEVMRPSSADEAAQFDRVVRLARELRAAIEQSPLPKDSACLRSLTKEGAPDVMLMVGWRDLRDDGYELGYPLAIVDVLDLAIELAEFYRKALPVRSIARHKGNPLVSAFVRWLAYFFSKSLGAELHGTIARVANAALDLSDPLDKNRVQAILKDAPPPLRVGASVPR